jgi:hypothetical protein
MQCIKWNAGRQPGAFRRLMIVRALFVFFYPDSAFHVGLRPQYSYLGSIPMFMAFGVGIATLKFKEGVPTPILSEVMK